MAPSSQWQAVHRCSTVLACVSSQKEENEEIEGEGVKKMAPNVGLEPTTLRLRVSCSTDWASRACWHRLTHCRPWHNLPLPLYLGSKWRMIQIRAVINRWKTFNNKSENISLLSSPFYLYLSRLVEYVQTDIEILFCTQWFSLIFVTIIGYMFKSPLNIDCIIHI